MVDASSVPEKAYGAFLKGLITDTTPLGYPEGAVVDCDNVIIKKTGDITRRPGMTRVTDKYTYDLVENSTTTDNILSTYVWKVYGTQGTGYTADDPILVIADDRRLTFYDLETMEQLGSVGYTGSALASSVSITEGYGHLYVCGVSSSSTPFKPFYVETNSSHSSFTHVFVYITIRDLWGLDDGLAADEKPSTLSDEHLYNLYNQGWTGSKTSGDSAEVTTYSSVTNKQITRDQYLGDDYVTEAYEKWDYYPPNSIVWWMEKDSDGTPNFTLLDRFGYGLGTVARGHYLMCAWDMDYSAASSVDGLTILSSDDRPSHVGFCAGRCWWAMGDTIYFSQEIGQIYPDRCGMCYQVQDPTAEDLNDILATDGGTITIAEMGEVRGLAPAGSGMLVLASNGCWLISGTSAGFSATDYSVAKVTTIDCVSEESIVETSSGLIWLSSQGFVSYAASSTVYTGGAISNISTGKVSGWLSSHIQLNSSAVRGSYDARHNIAQWVIYPDSNGGASFLTLDLDLGAFYPFSVSDISYFISPVYSDVVYSDDIETENTSHNYSVAYDDLNRPGFRYVRGEEDTDASTYSLWQEAFIDPSCIDHANNHEFETSDDTYILTVGGGTAYSSYFIVGSEMMGDPMRRKQIPHIVTYLKTAGNGNPLSSEGADEQDGTDYYVYGKGVTYDDEDYVICPAFLDSSSTYTMGIKALGDTELTLSARSFSTYATALTALTTALGDTPTEGVYSPYPDYSLKLQTQWDWTKSSDTGRWSTISELYRPRRTKFVDIDDTDASTWVVDPDTDTFPVRSRLRGRGRSVAFKFTCDDPGTNFDIYGWTIWYSGNPRP